MFKISVFVILFLSSLPVFSQKIDTAKYFLNAQDEVISNLDGAAYFLMILPPDPNVDKDLFVVQEYYRNGKPRLIGSSKTNGPDLKFQGAQIMYFPNGKRKRIANFENGKLDGDATEYYPNGKIYTIRNFSGSKGVFLKQCCDSAGTVMAEDGNGQWISYLNDKFAIPFEKGPVKIGLQHGEWHGELINVYFTNIYDRGKLISYSYNNKDLASKVIGDTSNFELVGTVPEFPGGLSQFANYLGKNVRYPDDAREKRIQGRVIVSFVVETDGKLTDVKVSKGVFPSLDEEAIRVMQLSPPWKPGIQNFKAVRVAYSVPISFNLAN